VGCAPSNRGIGWGLASPVFKPEGVFDFFPRHTYGLSRCLIFETKIVRPCENSATLNSLQKMNRQRLTFEFLGMQFHQHSTAGWTLHCLLGLFHYVTYPLVCLYHSIIDGRIFGFVLQLIVVLFLFSALAISIFLAIKLAKFIFNRLVDMVCCVHRWSTGGGVQTPSTVGPQVNLNIDSSDLPSTPETPKGSPSYLPIDLPPNTQPPPAAAAAAAPSSYVVNGPQVPVGSQPMPAQPGFLARMCGRFFAFPSGSSGSAAVLEYHQHLRAEMAKPESGICFRYIGHCLSVLIKICPSPILACWCYILTPMILLLCKVAGCFATGGITQFCNPKIWFGCICHCCARFFGMFKRNQKAAAMVAKIQVTSSMMTPEPSMASMMTPEPNRVRFSELPQILVSEQEGLLEKEEEASLEKEEEELPGGDIAPLSPCSVSMEPAESERVVARRRSARVRDNKIDWEKNFKKIFARPDYYVKK
jgi:hypothetical protein